MSKSFESRSIQLKWLAGVQLPNHDEAAVERQAADVQGEADQDHGRWEIDATTIFATTAEAIDFQLIFEGNFKITFKTLTAFKQECSAACFQQRSSFFHVSVLDSYNSVLRGQFPWLGLLNPPLRAFIE